MSSWIDTGKMGEELAAEWLKHHHFDILHRNWRNGRFEIDVIASKENVIHFVEVKTSRTHLFGFPEQRVGKRKIQHLISAAEKYLVHTHAHGKIQLDIISISISSGHVYCFFIEDICS
ncbi:MAG TPA: YraN family protein [Puia sp.]|nr:YraN family protein [Puia sp.]